MKIISLFFLLLPLKFFAQTVKNDYECVYEYSVKAKNAEIEKYSTILQFNNIHAKFVDYAEFQLDSLKQTGKANEEQLKKVEEKILKAVYYFDQTTFVNTTEKSIFVYSTIPPNNYCYREAINGIKWELQDETDTICGYPCNKAIGKYGGRTWNAWYSPEIPSPFGPWKLGGLPGLIMYAYDSTNTHQFRAIIFRRAATAFTTPQITNNISTSREKFIKVKNRFEENPMANIPAEDIVNMNIVKDDGGSKSIFINGMKIRLRTNGYVPLENE